MVIKYLYLDDEQIATVEPYRDIVVGSSKELSIDIEHPGDFADYTELIEKIKTKKYQGLILDWRLDDVSSKKTKRKAVSRAAALAQEIRTRESEKKMLSLPIVIWSQENRLKNSYKSDFTSHDLFNLVYKKEEIAENAVKIHNELVSLSLGYKRINKFRTKNRNINLGALLNSKDNYIDIRIQEYFSSNIQTVHQTARFIIRELLERPSLLIDERLVAARLGIDKDNSKDWGKLLIALKKHKYTGPFSDAWQRWWAYDIEKDWWATTSKQSRPISLLSSNDRLEIIKKNTKFKKIIAAKPIEENYHTRYYTICEYHERPLDPVDGVILSEKTLQPWQERRYVALDVVQERRGNFDLDPLEKERLGRLKPKRG
jgi:hypothetical protein